MITRDTVFLETLASRAMSLMVALRPGLRPAGLPVGTLTAAGALAAARVPVDLFRVRVMGWGLYGRIARKAGVSPNNARHATGVIGTVMQRRLPMPVKYRLGRLARGDGMDTGGCTSGNEFTGAKRTSTPRVAAECEGEGGKRTAAHRRRAAASHHRHRRSGSRS